MASGPTGWGWDRTGFADGADMIRRKLPIGCRRVVLLTVVDGVGDTTMEALSLKCGGPPGVPYKIPMNICRDTYRAPPAREYAFTPCEAVPSGPVTLGSGVTFQFSIARIAHFKRLPLRETDAKTLRCRKGHGRPPTLRDSWTELAWRAASVFDSAGL